MCVLENVGGCNGFYYNGVFQQGHNDNLSSLETMEELYLGEGMGGSGREKGSVKVQVPPSIPKKSKIRTTQTVWFLQSREKNSVWCSSSGCETKD